MINKLYIADFTTSDSSAISEKVQSVLDSWSVGVTVKPLVPTADKLPQPHKNEHLLILYTSLEHFLTDVDLEDPELGFADWMRQTEDILKACRRARTRHSLVSADAFVESPEFFIRTVLQRAGHPKAKSLETDAIRDPGANVEQVAAASPLIRLLARMLSELSLDARALTEELTAASLEPTRGQGGTPEGSNSAQFDARSPVQYFNILKQFRLAISSAATASANATRLETDLSELETQLEETSALLDELYLRQAQSKKGDLRQTLEVAALRGHQIALRKRFTWKLMAAARRLEELIDRTFKTSFSQQRTMILASGFFDAEWYNTAYPDVAAAGFDACTHFIEHGATEGRDPGPHFSAKAYLQDNPDVAAQEKNALLHYLVHGVIEGRVIRPSSLKLNG